MRWPVWLPDHRKDEAAAAFAQRRRSEQPGFLEAVLEDARVHANYRSQRIHPRSRLAAGLEALRLCVITDCFAAQLMYRAKVRLQVLRIPLLPHVCHRLAVGLGQICIGDPVLMHPGVYIPHGQVVVDGITTVSRGVVLAPFSTIGLRANDFFGPTLDQQVKVGTGARVIGPVTVGRGATIGANAVVVHDVAPRTTVSGIPARPHA